MPVPKPQLILGYKEFFRNEMPSDRLGLLSGFCQKVILGEIAGLNYRLKNRLSKYHDVSIETQVEELFYFCGGDTVLFNQLRQIPASHTKDKKNYPLIFTRQTCLFAFEELVQSEMEIIPEFTMRDDNAWFRLLSYLLCVNTVITGINESDEKDVINFETLNPKMVPLNELCLNSDPIYTPYRGYMLLDFFNNHEKFSLYFKQYFASVYSMTYDQFIYEIMSMYFSNNNTDEVFNFFYKIDENSRKQFEALSQTIINPQIDKLLNVRKHPFFSCGNNEFLLSDNTLLCEKCYNQFINDFWFDWIKAIKDDSGNEVFPIKMYKSAIGYFFEEYVDRIIKYLFQNSRYYSIKTFSELKTVFKGNEIEIADIYVRYNSQILLGQVKSTSIYDNEKYSGNIDGFYKNDRNKFFESFGVDQLVKSIKLLKDTILSIDSKFPVDKPYRIYPVIIFNERALQTPLMAKIFQDRFLELNKEFNEKKVHIYPISLLHISDLERVEDYYINKPNTFWEILNYHVRDSSFMPPFYNSLDRKGIQANYNKVYELFKQLVPKFSNKI